jgi:hypothetical protein
MISKILLFLFHLAVIVNYILFIRHSKSVDETLNKLLPRRSSFGGQFKYLTHWNVWLQAIFFIIALANDVFGTESRTKQGASWIQKVRDFLFSSIVFPTGAFVTIAFWSIYLVDRKLIFPVELDKFFPPITNHMMHTTPLVSQILELLFVYHVQPTRFYGLRYGIKIAHIVLVKLHFIKS